VPVISSPGPVATAWPVPGGICLVVFKLSDTMSWTRCYQQTMAVLDEPALPIDWAVPARTPCRIIHACTKDNLSQLCHTNAIASRVSFSLAVG
jgi:hypothetical protein